VPDRRPPFKPHLAAQSLYTQPDTPSNRRPRLALRHIESGPKALAKHIACCRLNELALAYTSLNSVSITPLSTEEFTQTSTY